MAENGLQILIKGIFSRIKEKYGYTDEQALIYLKGYEDCAEEHQQSLEKRDKMLRDTVAELCEAKQLLKLAVEDFAVYGALKDLSAEQRVQNPDWQRFNRVFDILDHRWRYTDEALKLLGKDEGNEHK